MSRKNKKFVGTWVTPEQKDGAERYAKSQGKTLSDVIREYLDKIAKIADEKILVDSVKQ